MALETLQLAIGPDDEDRIDELTETVTDIAGPADSEVVIFHAFTEDELQRVASKLDFDEPADAAPAAVAGRDSSVREIQDRFDDLGINYRLESSVGDHGDVIVEYAEETDADLLVIGGRQRTPAGKAVFGSTAQQILLQAPCPVTFVKERL